MVLRINQGELHRSWSEAGAPGTWAQHVSRGGPRGAASPRAEPSAFMAKFGHDSSGFGWMEWGEGVARCGSGAGGGLVRGVVAGGRGLFRELGGRLGDGGRLGRFPRGLLGHGRGGETV